jgi:2-C-methyl-D-erythritol 4-phosphate cytidylyltransferase
VIIVAGGIGSRMKSDRPKQFIDLNGEPIIVRTIKTFLGYNPSIKMIIVVHRNFRNYLENLLDRFQLRDYSITITLGGDTRFASVRNGLALIDDMNAVVAIHDAARPLVSSATIKSCFETAAAKGNAIPCVPVQESIRKISNNVNNSVNRNEYRIIQTPQCFIVSKIKSAFDAGHHNGATDDATVLESSGETIHLVEGNEENIKITSPNDLKIASAILSNDQR